MDRNLWKRICGKWKNLSKRWVGPWVSFLTSPLGANIDPPGVKLSPRSELCPLGMKLSPWGEILCLHLHSSKQ
jgi:hypothetical protein